MRITDQLLDIRDELKATNEPVTVQATLFRASIPSISSLNEFWPESKQLIAAPHNLQRIISSPTSAISVGFNLLVALCALARQKSRNALFEQQSLWILDTCDELWHYFRRWTTGSHKRPLHDETITLYMQVVEMLAIPGSQPRYCSSGPGKAVLMSISCVARLIDSLATSPMSDTNQTQLALMVTRLCHLAQSQAPQKGVLDRRRQPSEVFDAEMLKQSARRICENTEVLPGLQKDLQVRATRHCLTHVVNMY